MYNVLWEEVQGALWTTVHHGNDASIVEELSDPLIWKEYAMYGEAKHTYAMRALAD